MRLSLGSYSLTIREWQTSSELKAFANRFQLEMIEIDSDWVAESRYYSITETSQKNNWGIELINSDFRPPILLLDYKNLILIIGVNDAIYFINIAQKRVTHKVTIYTLAGIHSLYHIDISDFFIVETELNILALSYSGELIWEYDAHDVITHFELQDKYIVVKKMETDKSFSLDLYTGVLVAGSLGE
jgi:hypothetical protein